jgi:hypothetical protein
MKASPSKGSKTSGGKKRSCCEAEGSTQELSPPASPHPNPAKEWKKSKLKTEDLLALVNSGFLWEKEMELWRATAGDPYPMEKNPDEIPMFARFVERGLAVPASDFSKVYLYTMASSTRTLIPTEYSMFPSLCTSAKRLWESSPTAFFSGSSSE